MLKSTPLAKRRERLDKTVFLIGRKRADLIDAWMPFEESIAVGWD